MGRRLVLALVLLLVAAALIPAGALANTPPPGYSLLDGARNGQYLRYGSQGPAVAALQRALTAAGFPVTDTGYFGNYTLAAVRGFQAQQGLAADGVVGPQTVAALDRALGLVGGATPTPGPGVPATGIPARPSTALTGSEFMNQSWYLSRPDREAAIFQEIALGNIPDFERTFVEVTVSITDAQLRPHTVTFRVMPDYLAIGSNQDFVRMPMSPLTAQRIADRFGCSLPTRKMVNDIWRAASAKLTPSPMTPGAQMMSNDYYWRHQQRIETQRLAGGFPLGWLTGGHKKDVVISNRLLYYPNRVAIYGWHWPNGQPIQPLSTVHENTYADYSHGIRLVHSTVVVDGVPRAIADILRDPVLHRLLSDEGAMASPRIPGV